MKMRTFFFFAAAMIAISSSVRLRAGEPSAASTPLSANADSSQSSITDERTKIMEANRKASESPDVKKLREAAENAERAYQVAFTAALAEQGLNKQEIVLATMLAQGSTSRTQGMGLPLRSKDVLNAAERQRFNDARKKAIGGPDVQAALAKRNSARNAEEGATADEEFKRSIRKAILEIDPGLETVLQKLEDAK